MEFNEPIANMIYAILLVHIVFVVVVGYTSRLLQKIQDNILKRYTYDDDTN